MMDQPDERLLAAVTRLKGEPDFLVWVEALEQERESELELMRSGEGPAMHRAQGSFAALEKQLDLIHNPRKPDTPKRRGRAF